VIAIAPSRDCCVGRLVQQGRGLARLRDGGGANIRVGSKVGGRILQVFVREGDRVQPGQTWSLLTTKNSKHPWNKRGANAQKARCGFRREEIEEPSGATQAKADYEMHLKGTAKGDIAAAQTDVIAAILRMKPARGLISSATSTGGRKISSPSNSGTRAKQLENVARRLRKTRSTN